MTSGGLSTSASVLGGYDLLPMAHRHLDEVLAIERMSYTNPWPREAFVHEIARNPLSRPSVASARGRPLEVAGYCVYWLVFEHLHVQNVAVHPRHRRRGVARLLLLGALSHGRASGARLAQLEVRRSNAAALRLYESLGFEPAGERRNYYARPREDAVLLSQCLPLET